MTMKVVKFGEKIDQPLALCLGYFACLHQGHLKLVEEAKHISERVNGKTAIFTFSQSPKSFFGKTSGMLFTEDERMEIFKNCGIDYVIVQDFNTNFANLPGKLFLDDLLGLYDVTALICGQDYTFGVDRLTSDCVKSIVNGRCMVSVVDSCYSCGEKIGTDYLLNLLHSNQIAELNALLSEPFFITGVVVHGRAMGRNLHFPTANINVGCNKELPVGVFEGKINVNGSEYKAVVNIGAKPTFGISACSVEAHLIGFAGDLYGQTIKLVLTKCLRSTKAFNSSKDLIRQLQDDVERVKND